MSSHVKVGVLFRGTPDFEPGRLTAVNKFEDCHRRICRYTCNLRYIRPCLVESPSPAAGLKLPEDRKRTKGYNSNHCEIDSLVPGPAP
jgi:hypothetical protein